jgi:nucleotide sugar dehydrogenase
MSQKLVVVGLGYVGLPLAREAVRSGLTVVGLDVRASIVSRLNAGRSHVDDLSDDDVAAMRRSGFRASVDPSVLSDADVAVICVPTPLTDVGGPDLRAVESASQIIAAHLHQDMLVVLESTSYPGTTEEFVQPLLEETGLKAGTDFHLAFSPERIDPGNERFGLRNTPKIVGGVSPGCTTAATAFYAQFVDTVVPAVGAREAEMAKLLENTYRHINIALVNEMARFCHELEIDLWDVIRCAATKPFGFQAFYPGPGVGGHCIPIDPNYLSYQVKAKLGHPFRFVELAEEINASMPAYVAQRVEEQLNAESKSVIGARVLLLGVTYKPDISDQRESPALPLAMGLQESGADVSFHDPHVEVWQLPGRAVSRVADLKSAVRSSDIVVLLQNHVDYDVDRLARLSSSFLDTRGAVSVPGMGRL